jgi:ClpP class serine protease
LTFFDFFWLFIILFSLGPLIKQKMIEASRVRLLHEIQRKRGSRVIAMIHRQEAISLLGIPFFRYIDIEDSEQVLRAIRITPDDVPIDMIIHTPGGLVLASEQIAMALCKHPAKVTVFVPHYAMSGGTLIALAADEIVMDENAVLGPVDPQLGEFPAASILNAVKKKDTNKLDDKTLILADVARKAIRQARQFLVELLRRKMPLEKARKLARILSEGRWTHDYPITYEEAKSLGLSVSKDMPPEIYTLMKLYPQSPQKRPSVQYVPIPRGKEEKQ